MTMTSSQVRCPLASPFLPTEDSSDLDNVAQEDFFHGGEEWEIQIEDPANLGGIIAGEPSIVKSNVDNNVPQEPSGECSAPGSPIIDILMKRRPF